MAEKWLLKCYDGEEYLLNTTPPTGQYDRSYNLLIGTSGHHGIPVTIKSDVVPRTAGTEFREVIRDKRTLYLPLYIMGDDPNDLHKNIARLRKSLNPDAEQQLWITNESGETKVLYCRYSKGFDALADDEKRGPNFVKIPLYLEAADPFFYDPPGTEISRNFSSKPWGSNFFTFTNSTGLIQDAHIGDTTLTVQNTANCAAGKSIEIKAGNVTVTDDVTFSEDETPVETLLPVEETTITLGIDTGLPHSIDNDHTLVYQATQIFGKLLTTTGRNCAYKEITIERTCITDEIQDVTDRSINVGDFLLGEFLQTPLIIAMGDASRFHPPLPEDENVVQPDVFTKIFHAFTDIKGAFNITDYPETEGVHCYHVTFDGDDEHDSCDGSTILKVGSTIQTALTLLCASSPVTDSPFALGGTLKTASTVMSGDRARELGYVLPTTHRVSHECIKRRHHVAAKVTTDDGEWSQPNKHGIYHVFTLAAGKPIGGQKIKIYKSSSRYNAPLGTVTTDSSGLYSFTVTETKAHWVSYKAVFESDYEREEDRDTERRRGHKKRKRDDDHQRWNWDDDLAEYIFDRIEGRRKPVTYTPSHAKLRLKIGANVYYLNYQVALPPSMVNDGEIQYFGHNGFNGVIVIAESIADNYATELATITAQGLWKAIDISVVTDGLAYLSTASATHTWLHSLYTAGWRYVAGVNTTGRTTDPSYITSHFGFTGYINLSSKPRTGTILNEDVSGTGVYRNSFQCFSEKSMPFIEAWTESAYEASPSVKSGLLGAVVPDDTKGINEMLTNSSIEFAPSYEDIIDWSHENDAAMDTFTVWFHPKNNAIGARDYRVEKISEYKSLGFEAIIEHMRERYLTSAVTGGTTYTWAEPTAMGVNLTMDYTTTAPLTFSGILTRVKDSVVVPSATISLELKPVSNICTLEKTCVDTPAAEQPVILFSDTTGFIVGATVGISGSGHSETGVIESIASNTSITLTGNLTYDYIAPTVTEIAYPSGQHIVYVDHPSGFDASDVVTISDNTNTETLTISTVVGDIITFTGNLAHSYDTTATVLGEWDAVDTDVTDVDGAWSIETTASAGEHFYRAHYAGDGTHMAYYAPTYDGEKLYHTTLTNVTQIGETNAIASIVNPTTLTLTTPIANDYLITNDAYFTEIDSVDTFLTPDSAVRTVNNCELVVFWMRGCPPCYTAKAQVKAIQSEFNSVDLTFVEIQDLLPTYESTELSIGMEAAALRYPDAYDFAMKCGPPLPTAYHAVGNLMPAVICLYRDDLFIKAWCGVHTTGLDPVTSDVIEDACGPRFTWRLGESYIGERVVVVNEGDDIAYPIWTLTGPGRSPVFKNITTGQNFQLNHDLRVGEAVVIDATEHAHTCGSTAGASYNQGGYMKATQCPTCQGTGVIAASCTNCGGSAVCPTCFGSGEISTWVPVSSGSTNDIGGMFNLRFQIDENAHNFWGFVPGANVIEIEMGVAYYKKSMANLKLIQKYDGI